MHKDHPSCKAPSDTTVKLWRYMDISKLLSILEGESLYFPKIDHLGDPLEGFLNRATVKKFRTLPDTLPDSEKAEKEKIIEQNLQIIKQARSLLYVSSWHMNDFESAAMWKLYLKSDEGIAIQSTYERFRDSFKKTEQDILISTVTYVDEDNDEIDWTNVINYALHKRKSFEHEKELRAVILIHLNQEGIFVPVDIGTLIEKIYVAPNSPKWIHDLLNKVVKRYKLNIEVEQSKLFEDPIY